jgi:ElaB/YqjD/DUF883 family membrane-anchored ribosome-binding protein
MKNRNADGIQSHADFLKELRVLVTDAEALLAGVSEEGGKQEFTTLRDRFDTAQQRAGQIYTDTKKKVVAGAKRADEAIRANPYQSLFLALGAGLLIGAVVGRRSRSTSSE